MPAPIVVRVPSTRPNFFVKGPTPCSQAPDPDIFTTDPHDENFRDNTKKAKARCENGCPYKLECYAWALAHPEEEGVWGGTTDKERRKIRRRGVQFLEVSADSFAEARETA